MAPRLPVRSQQRLRAQFPGLGPDELADPLILGASRAAASVGATVGAAMLLPLPAAPVEVAVETLALVGIEIKLVAELHEVYGQRAAGLGRRAHAGLRRGLGPAARRGPGARAVSRWPWAPRCAGSWSAGCSPGRAAVPLSLGPLLTGAAAGRHAQPPRDPPARP